jgi:hypothetical protein
MMAACADKSQQAGPRYAIAADTGCQQRPSAPRKFIAMPSSSANSIVGAP